MKKIILTATTAIVLLSSCTKEPEYECVCMETLEHRFDNTDWKVINVKKVAKGMESHGTVSLSESYATSDTIIRYQRKTIDCELTLVNTTPTI